VPPALLVSVREEREARVVLAAGVRIVDIKEPGNGPMGAASPAVQRRVAALARELDGVLVTAALGELPRRGRVHLDPVPGIALYKFGLSGWGGCPGWRKRLDLVREGLRGGGGEVVAVAYADSEQARSPLLSEVLAYVLERRLPYFLLDTWEKASGSLTRWCRAEALGSLIEEARRGGVRVALAGSLKAEDLPLLRALGPDIIAVRGAACAAGRGGTVDAERVRVLLDILNPRDAGGTAGA
jgi:uncharacterized protein (UPF0264 family)